MTKVLLYSGGLDSWLIDKLWKPDVKLYVDTGSLGSKAEIEKLGDDVVVEKLDIHKFELRERNYLLPLRNLYFCMIAMNYGDEICLGATASSKNLDKNETFCDLAGNVLSYLAPQVYAENVPERIKIVVPFKQYTKKQLLEMYVAQGGSLDLAFKSTSSCYNPKEDKSPCLECSSCLKRIEAFKELGYEPQ